VQDISSKTLPVENDNLLQATNWVSNPYIAASTSDNTRKAYRSDIRQFEIWGGVLPATPESVVMYLQANATQKNATTLARRLVAIKHWHTYQNFPDPTAHPIVQKTMIGIRRLHGKPKLKAPALSLEALQQINHTLDGIDGLTALRDKALLQIGFFGALRRSELVAICFEHISFSPDGIEILLPVSKTDQLHAGQICAIPYGNKTLCPIKALKEWLNATGISQGPVFRRLMRSTLGELALTPLSVHHILQKCAKLANVAQADKLSPHSLRRGLATCAARAKTPIQAIMRAGRWKQVNTVMEYIEASERFSDNAAGCVLQTIKSDE